MKAKHNILIAALMAPMIHAADIDVIGDSAYSSNSFVTLDGGVDGGLGTNIRIINGTSVTWTKNNTYFISDKLFIPRGATLTIEPGTKVYFSVNDNGTPTTKTDDKVGAITACRGGKLIADGTAAEPIVFTSVREWEALNNVDSAYDPDTVIGPAPTAADAGQWGGIVLLGQAYVSVVDGAGTNAGTMQIEGFAPAGSHAGFDSIPDATQYGPSTNFTRNDSDNSGTVRYVSIRHGGYEFTAGKEINGLTLGGVGSRTIIQNVEVYANQDDGIEFFGGTVNTKNIVMAFNQDDSFDMDEAYQGTNQFWLSVQNPGAADAGFEADGVGGTAAGYNLGDTHSNQSNPKIYNATIIGAGRNNTLSQLPLTTGTVQWEKGNHAMLIEDRFAGEIYNSVFDDFAGDLIRFNDTASSTGARFVFQNNTVGRFGNVPQKQIETLTVTMSANATATGTLTVVVTGAGITGSPLNVPVSIVNGDSRATVTTKIFTELNASAAITALYDVVAGATGVNYLIAKTAGSNDNTLNINIPGNFGITAQASSGNTQAGAATSVTAPVTADSHNLTYLTNNYTGAGVYDALGAPIEGNSNGNTDPMFTAYTRDGSSILTALNPVPQAGSPLLSGAVTGGAPTVANYRGAFGTSNWAAGWTKLSQSGVLQGAGAPATVVDTDGDGLTDALESTTALTALGFSSSVNNVTNHGGVASTNLFGSLYTATSIQSLRGTGLMVQANGTDPVTLTLPLFKSTDMINWTPAGNATATTPFVSGKQFYRVDLSSGAVNP